MPPPNTAPFATPFAPFGCAARGMLRDPLWGPLDKLGAGSSAGMLRDVRPTPGKRGMGALVSGYAANGESLVLACSALKSSYREALASPAPEMATIYLRADPGLVRQRLAQRRGHYMPAELLESQFEALDEPTDTMAIPAAWPPDQIVAAIRDALGV